MQHTWVPSTLGHGEAMCSRCFVTNREAAAIGMLICDAPAPKPANENKPWTQEQIDAEIIDDDECTPHTPISEVLQRAALQAEQAELAKREADPARQAYRRAARDCR